MKVEELVGKVVVRNKNVLVRTSGYIISGGDHEDTSFTARPIKIEGIKNGIVFYRDRPGEKIEILAPRYLDESWAQIPDELLAEFWDETLVNQ